ncbi:MAG TPA: RsmE family RNA methyltransferase [Chitinophagaceae bacterium]|nr:RsmE family RNA methyltransferase [Chitinophagaceae bacterium]
MELPFFFMAGISDSNETLVLDEDTSKHVAQVLRMREGEQLRLTDGKGRLATAEILDAHKKKTSVKIIRSESIAPASRTTTIAISLLKNANRFEWFLEKATELGMQSIMPLLCEHTERQHFRFDRMQAVLVSAMLQSQQAWLPQLHEPMPFKKLVEEFNATNYQQFIAHCADDADKKNLRQAVDHTRNVIVLIGPEGDFSKDEIQWALRHGFVPVSLGDTRLRAETAGIVAATLIAI